MVAKEEYVMGMHMHLVEEKCIEVLEQELDTFFEIRLKSIYLIYESYIRGYVKNFNDVIKCLNLSEHEIKAFIETVIYKISKIINCSFYKCAIYFNKHNEKAKYIHCVKNNINEFRKTENVLSFCEWVLDKSLSKMFAVCCHDKIINYAFNGSNFPKKILGSISLKNQKQKHSGIISEQIRGFLLNLKYDLRNDLLQSIFFLINSEY
ncbi:hypothetical protein [Clostridium sp. BL-8]|uniref:hypothetical protein n=1 Tax=Clostridium sp. BL-8 TaxID=349938 RepID=UPI0011779178|nr:hypothetical protein [Clostridium sp. BL-8]